MTKEQRLTIAWIEQTTLFTVGGTLVTRKENYPYPGDDPDRIVLEEWARYQCVSGGPTEDGGWKVTREVMVVKPDGLIYEQLPFEDEEWHDPEDFNFKLAPDYLQRPSDWKPAGWCPNCRRYCACDTLDA